jgi:hypothetical protein
METALPAARNKLETEAALTDSGSGHNADHLTAPAERALQGGLESLHLPLSADELGQAPRLRHFQARSEPARALELVDSSGRRKPLHGESAEVAKREITGDQPGRGLAHVDASRIGELLEPRGEAHGLPLRRVVHPQIVADLADHDLARMDADSRCERQTVAALHVLGVTAELAPQIERRVTGARCMILVSDRRAEQRHDAVTGVLVDGSLEAVDAVGEQPEEAVEDRMPLFRVEPGSQVHRLLHVREEHRHLLALAFEGAAGGEDLLCEVLRSVTAWVWRGGGC